MTQLLDPASMIEAAQTAAAAGDYPAAERLLRNAASAQEARLGPVHPDLASTLNNLALVYEQTQKIAEAEQSYRRAHAIAVASLLPGHPSVATSLKNLVDFCEAHDIPLWRPPASLFDDADSPGPPIVPPPDVADRPATRDRDTGSLDQEFVSEPAHAAVAVTAPPRRRVALVALAAAAIVVVSIVMRWPEASPASGSPAPPPTAAAVTAATAPEPLERNVQDSTVLPLADHAKLAQPSEPRDDTSRSVTVVNAQLCSAIEKQGSPDWQCTSATGDVPPGTYTFYTRLRADADTTVEHRWYRDDRVHQVVRLRISANPGSGYRTFSNTTISAERVGNWKVELRAADGTPLHEQHFVAR